MMLQKLDKYILETIGRSCLPYGNIGMKYMNQPQNNLKITLQRPQVLFERYLK